MSVETTSLPTQDSDQDDIGSVLPDELHTYAVRITSHDKFKPDQLVEFIRNEPLVCKFVIGRETVPQEHFHIVLSVHNEVSEEDVRGIIRAFLVPFWQDNTTFKLPKGFGNKQYNLQISHTPDDAVRYAVKHHEIWYEGYTQEVIELRKAESFVKKKTSDFRSLYRDLCDRFQESNMDIREFMISMADLKAKFDQAVNMHSIYGYALSQLIKRDECSAEFVENFLYKQ